MKFLPKFSFSHLNPNNMGLGMESKEFAELFELESYIKLHCHEYPTYQNSRDNIMVLVNGSLIGYLIEE